MAIAWDVGAFAALGTHQLRNSANFSSSSLKLENSGFLSGTLNVSNIAPRKLSSLSNSLSNLPLGVTKTSNQDVESFLLSTMNMNFLERLNLAWKLIFPSAGTRRSSNAMIAKQRLKMILFSDRCAVSDEAKRKIVKSIVSALSDFVEIESQDKVQLSVSTDTDIGTVYSVTVPVRFVKPEYTEVEEAGSIMNVEYRDNGEASSSVDVKFDFYVPNGSS